MAGLSAVALGASTGVDYGSAALAAAIVAAALTVLAATVMPVVRPAPDAHVAVH